MIKSKVKTKDGSEYITAYEVNEAELPVVEFSNKQRYHRIYQFCDIFACFDTETSHIELEDGWVYQWAFKFGETYIYGRTPSEFIELLERMKAHYKLSKMKQIIIYVHNLAYDYQYMKRYLMQYDESIEVMALDNHSILIVDICGFRFLCSYKVSNMSLDTFSNNYATKYIKASGAINYNIVRYQDSELTDNDWYYMFSDVASQYDAIENYLNANGYDKAFKAPYTSTGFVREDCRRAARAQENWRAKFRSIRLTEKQYSLFKQAFMGGITIASYKYANQLIENVELGHRDFTSSYPARQMENYFPIGTPTDWGKVKSLKEFKWLLKKYCCCFLLTVTKIQIKSGVTAPYIPSSKCIGLKGELKVNGKIIYADELTIALTEIDFKWIEKQYDFKGEFKVSHMVTMNKGTTPDWLQKEIMKYYKGKCELKHSDPLLYLLSKSRLNSIYGMSATSIIRQHYKQDENGIIHKVPEDEQSNNSQLEKFYNSYNSFMPYQFGVWTTAHARDALMTMISEVVGYENFLYCDTDSVFYIKTPEIEKRFEEYNKNITELATRKKAFIGDNILGLATEEPPIRAFKALHAKCYACEELNEKTGKYELKVTIAGIPKKTTKWIDGKAVTKTNAEELGDIDNLKDGFIFRHCGGTRAVYIEAPTEIKDINGHRTELASSVIVDNIEKEINDTMYSVGKDYSMLNVHFEQIYE